MNALAYQEPALRRVAVYVRVSSDDQEKRGTIATQADELHRRLAAEEGVVIVSEYSDDGVSGAIALEDRPGGARLVADAREGVFDEAWFYDFDRLGRDSIENAIARRTLKRLGVRLFSLHDGEPDDFMFEIKSAVAANERRTFLRRSADGMKRAAREGRWCGGIVPLGFRLEGTKQNARLVPDDSVIWADKTAADLVRDIYERIALRGQSCRVVAHEFNTLGIPTYYARDGRGIRGKATQRLWRAGRIRNLVVNTVYRGELQYGRRIDQRSEKTERTGHEIISAPIGGLVSPALWQAAQEAFAANRRCAKNTHRVYLLKGVMKCGICGLSYVGSWSKEFGWYRCGGQLVERGPIPGKCLGVSVRTDRIEPAVWADIEAWLRNPGDIIDQLDGVAEREAQAAIAETERLTLARRLETLESERRTALDLRIRGRLSDPELEEQLDRIGGERAALQARLAASEAPVSEVVPQEVRDLLSEVRARLDGGLDEAQRQEIVRLLVGIVVHTSVAEDGSKSAKALVTYRFPGVVPTCTGTGSWVNYTTVRRVIELPVGRQKVAVG